MSKINFNVPFLNESGQEIHRPITNEKKLRYTPDGRAVPEVQKDAEGFAVLKVITVREMLVQILTTPLKGDEAVSYSDKVRRGKLARKIETSNTANYTPKDLAMIEELASQMASVTLLAQIDDLLNGPETEEKEMNDDSAKKDAA